MLGAHARHILARDHRHQAAAQCLVRGQAGQAFERRIHEGAAVVEIDLDDADRALAHEGSPPNRVGERADDIRVAPVEWLGVRAFERGERWNACHRASHRHRRREPL
ncbi:MAG: hypothetical protein M3Q30_16130 [Actinomycetota bacterium]|nr:hypothetical protein [Actinomycetota bacterium]